MSIRPLHLLSLYFAVVLIPTDKVSAQICRDWKSYNNNCYKVFVRSLTVKGKTWDDAENDCKGYGGHLASIADQAEQTYLQNQIKAFTNERFWIGYNDRKTEGTFKWTDGSSASYTNWRSGEPNNYNNEDCAEVNFNDGKWNDDNCALSISYICKRKQGTPWPTQATVSPPVTQKPVYCGAGWESYTGSCYKFSKASKTWLQASKDCRNSGGYLVSVDNANEQHYLSYRLKTLTQPYWIGLNDRAIEGIYVWDGDNAKVNYTNWFPGEPNDFSGREDCIQMYNGFFSGAWNDQYCDKLRPYICEIPKGQSLCPVNWMTFGEVCFEFNTHPAQAVTWSKARDACKSTDGAELASILSQDENTFIFKQLKDLKAYNVWLGLNDIQKEGLFVWSDRSTFTFANWMPNEPARGAQAAVRDCTLLLTNTDNGTWATQNCSYQRTYVCKRNRGHDQCNSPLGMQTLQIADSQITASSMQGSNAAPSQARLKLQSSSVSAGSWCANINAKGEYLQIDFGLVRKITHISIQGRPKSSDFVKTFYIRYGSNGQNFITYGQNRTQSYTVLTGSSNSDGIANVILAEAINCRFIRFYPLTWSNNICLRTEVYGCDGQVTSTKCRKGWEEGPDSTCYQYNTNRFKAWPDARASCTSQGGDLLSIVSVNERAYIDKRMKTLASSVNSFWIGLNDRESNRMFQWSDQNPFVLTRWDAGYPKDSSRTNSRACVELIPARLAWRDTFCGLVRPYICKRKITGPQNTKKYSKTSNWISATDAFWPLDGLVNGKALGTIPAQVSGDVTKAVFQNKKASLRLNTRNAYLQAGNYQSQCISDADVCTSGLSVSLIIYLNGSTWNQRTFLVDSIGDNTLKKSRGFAIYIEQGQVKASVFTTRIGWAASTPISTGAWHHVAFTWLNGAGLKLYVDGKQKASDASGTTLTPTHTSNNYALTVGSKSTRLRPGYYYMRTLAVWKRMLDPSEVTDIYTAELGFCSLGWKEFGQYCYQFNSGKKSWPLARSNCQKQGGDLVSITSPVEQAHITLEVTFFGLNSYAWIGFHDRSIESAWEWSDGSPARFTNWNNYQPDDYFWHGEDCAHTYHQRSIMGRWNDIRCTTNMASICKRKKVLTTGTTPSLAARQQIICEWSSDSLNCPSSTVISVQKANYGRTDKSTCGSISVTNCLLNVTTKLKSMCDGLSFCSVNPTNQLFGNDPCKYIRKYLDVTYKCVKGTTNPICPDGWQRGPDGNLCYGLMLEKKNWADARASCKKSGGELASIHFGWESVIITSLLVKSFDAGDVWIGLTDQGQRGVYRWSDDSPVGFTHWWNGQPNDRNVNGSCVRATLTASMRDWMYWMDDDCSKNLAYVCKKFRKGITPPPKKPTTVPVGPCQKGYKPYLFGCYWASTSKQNWLVARSTCYASNKNADLVSIHDAAENTFVQSLTNGSSSNAWIGLNDRGTLSGHVWSDGKPVRFTKWGPQQPDSHSGQQPCVIISPTGYWSDVGCFALRNFICKYKRPSSAVTTAPTTVATPVPTAPTGTCDPGWKYWNKMCYLFSKPSVSAWLSWFDARSACRKAGGDLTSILSAAENGFLYSNIRSLYSWGVTVIWFGLHDMGTEGSYKWSDGSPFWYTNYNWREPNDWQGQEDCMQIIKWNGKWNDNLCGRRYPYICKKHNNTFTPPTIVAPTPGPAVGKCDPGWINYDKSCYKFVIDEVQTWANARARCQKKQANSSMNGDLVTINNQYEQAFIGTLLAGFRYHGAGIWIGLNDLHTENLFTWISNQPITYTNWYSNQPNRNWRLDCVDMWTGTWGAGRWIVRPCSVKRRYICEAPALPLGPTPVTPTPSADCPGPFTKYSIKYGATQCLAMFYTQLNWKEAREVCSKYGADLASIHSPFDQAFLVSRMLNFPGNVWIGLSRAANSQQFTWSDLSVQEYTHWSKGQPGAPGSSMSCVQATNSTNNDGRWAVADCGKKNGFMCQILKGDQHVTPVEHGTCLPGFKKFDKFCYLLKLTDKQTWSTARHRCNKLGGDLVSILNRQEKDFLVYQLKDYSWKPWVWTGLNDRAFERGYEWSDRSPVAFTAWAANQPNDNQGTENCVGMWTGSGLWYDASCTLRRGYICKAKLECSSPLGMASGNITNAQINASSFSDVLHTPAMGRLNDSSGWCASDKDKAPYFEVDLMNQMEVAKIGIKGVMLYTSQAFIKTFTLSYAVYKNQWKPYQVNGATRIFAANTDSKQVAYPTADPPIMARFLRIKPLTWNTKICAKFEFFGCVLECQKPLGIHSRLIRDELINASSQSDAQHGATQARPSIGRGWCPSPSDKNPYLQVTWPGFAKRITKIGTWGTGPGRNAFVTRYKLAFSDDGQVFTEYQEKGVSRIFRGNTDSTSQMVHALFDPIKTQYFRILPLSGARGGLCLRFEIYGCASGCIDPLGLETGTIEDSWISASSSLDDTHKPDMARLNAPRGWCATPTDRKPFLRVSLGGTYRIRKISTQGSPDGKGYVKSFYLRSFFRNIWQFYREFGDKYMFTANHDGSSVISKTFYSPNRAIQVEFLPQSWSDAGICMRVEIFGCVPNNVRPGPTSQPSVAPTVVPTRAPRDLSYKVTVKITSEPWNKDYSDRKTTSFKNLANKIIAQVTAMYSKDEDDIASLAFERVQIIKFSPGSVIVQFNITFFADIAKGANVMQRIKDTLNNGSLGNMTVDTKSFEIVEIKQSGGSTSAQKKGAKSGLSAGAKAGIGIVVILVVAGGLLLGLWWLRKTRTGDGIIKSQQFDNPIHFSSQAYDLDDPLPIPPE